MTSRRLPHTPAAGSTSGRYSEPGQPACLGKPEPYDVLVDVISGPAHRAAVREARELCSTCPLFATCLRDNRDEMWAKAILGHDLLKKPRRRDKCGTPYGYKLHRASDEKACEDCTAANRGRVAAHAARSAA